MLLTESDIRDWLPGDVVFDDDVYIPPDILEGDYFLDLAIIEPDSRKPHIKLAIEGRMNDGWYRMGKIKVKETIK